MRRSQIPTDGPVDEVFDREVRRRGTSKPALIGGAMARESRATPPPSDEDGWAELDGCLDDDRSTASTR